MNLTYQNPHPQKGLLQRGPVSLRSMSVAFSGHPYTQRGVHFILYTIRKTKTKHIARPGYSTQIKLTTGNVQYTTSEISSLGLQKIMILAAICAKAVLAVCI